MIPYTDLRAQYLSVRDELRAALGDALDEQQFILGEPVQRFEEAFAAYCGVKHAIAVNSGTSALHLALLAAGVEPGDEVITVSFTFVATVATVLYCGAKPVLIDIDPRSFAMDPAQVEGALSPRTKAILPVHLYGQPADMDPILEIARKHGITVIEDAAQAHGAEYKGCRTGGLGDAGCFSFYPTKNLGACGEGGMVTTNNAEIARKVRMLRDWGQDGKYNHVLPGFNYRMEGFQGAVLGVKLQHLDQWTEQRRRVARCYDHELEGADVARPAVMPYSRHVYHTYTIRSLHRDALRDHLQANGIQTAIHYPTPAHLQPAYAHRACCSAPLAETERAAREVLSLPMFAEMTDDMAHTVAAAVRSFPS